MKYRVLRDPAATPTHLFHTSLDPEGSPRRPTRTVLRAAARWLLTLGCAFAPALALAVDVQISGFTDNPDPAVRGGPITFTIVAENTDGDIANNVVVTYALPANTQFVSVSDAAVPGACAHDGASPGTVTCTYPTLRGTLAAPAGPTRTINVVLRTTGSSVATLNSTVNITTTDPDINPANNSLSQNTTVNNGADLSASLSGSPNPATGGDLVSWTVSGSNLGPNTSGPMTFTSTLPGVLTYVSAGSGGNGWSCGAAGQVVTCTSAAAAVGAYPSFPIVTRITGAAGGTVTLSGNISSSVGDPDSSNNSPVASVTVNPGTDLAVTQDPPSPNPATSGNAVTFTLRPSNLGPYPATAGAQVSFPLPAGFAFSSATPSAGWVCPDPSPGTTVTCTFAGSLASGASGVLTIVATTPSVATPTVFNNITATIAPNVGGPADPNASNNSATRSVTVSPDGLDLSVTKSKTPNFVALGANMTSTIVVNNAGPRTAASGSITLVDALDPTKEQYVGASGTNWSCVSAAPNVNCTYNAALGIGNSSTLTITTQALAAGTATNNATTSYSGTPGDFNSANDLIGASVSVTAANNSPDLQVALSAATAGGTQTTVEANETQIVYTVAVTNKVIATSADANSVVMTLSIPGRTSATNVTLNGTVLTNTSGTSNATFSCTGTGTGSTANVVCTQTGGTQLSPGDVVTFTVAANRVMVDGTFNANASAVSSAQGDPLPSDNTTSLPITIDPIADVEVVSKVLAANPVLAGTSAIYTITLRNNGPSSAANLSMSDVFTIPGGDTGFTFISATASNGGSCSGLTAGTSYSSGAPTVTCNWGAVVTNGDTRTVTVTVRPNWQSGSAARTLDNTATVSTTTAEDGVGGQGSASNSKSQTLNISPAQVDMLINDSDLVDPLGFDPSVPANNDITYAVVASNNGPSLASGVGFTFTMSPPTGKTITFRGDGAAAGVAAANPSGTISGSLCDQVGSSVTGPAILTVTCLYTAPGLLANAASITRHLVFRADSAPNTGGDTYTTSATAILNETDSNTSNNTEGETTTVRVRADLSIVKTPSSNPVQLREPFTWSIVVSNAGPGDSQTTGLTDTLPAGMVFGAGAPTWVISGGGASGTCSVAGQTMTCAFGVLSAGRNVTVTVPARVTSYPSGGATQNCASASTSEVDPNSANSVSICTPLTVQRSSIAGTVFQDRDRTGANAGTPQAAATEPRIAGVAVQLSGTDAYGNAVSLSTTTDASGNYSFTNLSPADASGYTVTQTQPAGFVNGPAAPPAPAAGGTYAGGGSAGNSSYGAILLAANTSGAGYDFPEVRQPSLSGFVYADVNLNNVRNPGVDSAIAGATVRLLNANTLALVATTTTDGTGAYTFANLDPLITYTLEEPLPSSPAGLANGPVNPGLVNGAVCASGCTAQPNTPSAGTDRIAAIDLGAGTDGTQFNFGEQQVSTISGFVFADVNNNGVQNLPGDIGLAGVTIVLTGTDATSATINRTTTTAADGSYSFANLLPGTYTVTEPTQPAGSSNGLTIPGTGGGGATSVATLPSAISGIVLTAAANASANNFAEIPSSSAIAGRVWLDANDNGSVDAGESGIAGVTIELTGTDANGPVSRTATTDATGMFSFGTLAPGVYTLREPTQPTGTLNGRTIAGTIGGSTSGTATNVATLPSAISTITLGVGQNSVANLFGEIPTGSIAGRVYGDNNNNGSIDAGETGLAGVTLTLSGTDDLGAPVNLTTTTAADGSYTFASLRPGTYAVTEPQQPGGTTNGITSAGSAGGSATAPSVTPSAITAIVLAAGANSTQNNFGEIGNSPDLLVSKDHALPRFTVHNAASYRIRVRNAGELATTGDYTVTDRLPVGLTLAATPSGAGWSCVGAAGASVFSCSANAVIASAASNPNAIDVPVTVGPQAATNSPVHNVVLVEGGGELDARRPTTAERDAAVNNPASLPVCSPATSHNVCRDPTVVQLAASLAGTVWYDGGSVPSLLDGSDTRLAGWQVEVVNTADNTVVARAVTGTDGSYRVPDLLPGVALAVRFREPQSGVVFGYPVNGEQSPGSSGASCKPAQALANGTSSSCVERGSSPQLGIVLAAGQDLTQQSLPVDPSGIVYDAGVRTPVAGAVVTLAPTGACVGWNPASSVVGANLGGYSVNGSAISMTVGASGFYQFLFAASAPASCQFSLSVTPPAGYTFVSKLIPPQAGSLTPPGATGSTYAVQPQPTAPTGAVGTATAYYLSLVSGSAGANIIHNHIPLDPALPNGISLSKTGDKSVAEVGDSVRYSIAVQLTSGELPRQLTVLDRLPAGFTYIKGTASVNGVAIADPMGAPGPQLAFNLGPMPADGKFLLQYRLRVGVGSQQGDGINRAIGHACGVPSGCLTAAFTPVASSLATNEAQHRVRVTGGVFAPEACVAGKIFVDCNGNQIQDREELGIPGVRLVLQDGTTLISDSEGKYSYCGLPPRSAVLKVDSATLPRGSRLVTSSNRNLGDANSLWLDLKNGELHRADFIEGSCSNPVLEQTKARRAQGEVRAPEAEKKGPALRFDSKAHGLSSTSSPQQGTDSANQTVPKARAAAPASSPSGSPPSPPPPGSPSTSTTATETKGGSDAAR